jgi:hypothetical protein
LSMSIATVVISVPSLDLYGEPRSAGELLASGDLPSRLVVYCQTC